MLSLLDTIPAMAWSVLPDGQVDFLNRRWLEYTGLSLSEALAAPTSVVHPGDVKHMIERWQSSLARGEPYEARMRLRGSDGSYRWFQVRTEPQRDEHGEIRKWYGTCTEIDAPQRAEGAAVDLLSTLSARELVVLRLVAEGLISKEIAARMGLTHSTVDSYRARIMEKLGVRNVVGLVHIAIRHGLVEP